MDAASLQQAKGLLSSQGYMRLTCPKTHIAGIASSCGADKYLTWKTHRECIIFNDEMTEVQRKNFEKRKAENNELERRRSALFNAFSGPSNHVTLELTENNGD